MTLKGEIQKIVCFYNKGNKAPIKEDCDICVNDEGCEQRTDKIISAIKARVPEKKPVRKENSQPLGMSESLDNIKNQGFNEARNQFLNEVEGK